MTDYTPLGCGFFAMRPDERERFERFMADYRAQQEAGRRWWWKAPQYSLPDVTLRNGPGDGMTGDDSL